MLTHKIALQFQSAIEQAGLNCPASIIADEAVHRFNQDGDKDNPCWYVIHIISDKLAYGAFGCWKRNINEKWCNRTINTLTANEKTIYKQKQDQWQKELKEAQTKAKESARYIWEYSSNAFTAHPYLERKQVKSFGLRLYKNMLLVPLYDETGEICSLQFITSTGDKWFKKNCRTRDCYFVVGNITDTIYIAEGYATAATIKEATNCSVVVAFNANNLLSVAKIIREKYPKHEIIVCADNDAFTTTGNTGVQKTTEAAKAINAKLAIPQFKNTKTKPTDFNDLMLLEGLDEAYKQLSDAKPAETTASNEAENKLSQAAKIIALTDDLELFHDKQNIAYVTIITNRHKETWRLDSPNFQNWLLHAFWKAHKKAISKNVLQDALGILQGKAVFEGSNENVHSRIAMVDGVIYINLANDNWEIIRVAKDGWQILQNCPIKFTRTPNMQPLPTPISGGNLAVIWQYLNISEKDKKLVLAFILECFRANTTFPLLVLYGTQGSAKSTTQEIIRKLIDPSAINLRSAPKKSEDLFVAAANNWVVSFNNVSHLSAEQQDDLCCTATGGGHGTRKLYTNNEEALVEIKRPVIINGIGDLVTAQDLIDRCVILELPTIEEDKRKTEEEIMREFNKDYPAIFGALLNILTQLLAELPKTKLDKKPRMADFAILGTALEKVMGWKQGSFMADYTENRANNMAAALEHSPIAIAITHFINDKIAYDGSYNQLFENLSTRYKPDMAGWAKSPKGLANQIKRHKQGLFAVGIEVTFDEIRHSDGYHVHIKKSENKVHKVHEVQGTIPGLVYSHELAHELKKPYSPSTQQVHVQNPYLAMVNEHSELSEHEKLKNITVTENKELWLKTPRFNDEA